MVLRYVADKSISQVCNNLTEDVETQPGVRSAVADTDEANAFPVRFRCSN